MNASFQQFTITLMIHIFNQSSKWLMTTSNLYGNLQLILKLFILSFDICISKFYLKDLYHRLLNVLLFSIVYRSTLEDNPFLNKMQRNKNYRHVSCHLECNIVCKRRFIVIANISTCFSRSV